jgi:GNAT superfamily N-acetyltransferase/predicted nucleic acid-binding protein
MHDGLVDMSVVVVQPDSRYLSDVKALWRLYSDTLGFFPDGAFDDHARRGSILACLGESDDFLGYLVFRRSRGQAAIVHLCVREQARGLGVARQLFETFREQTRNSRGAIVTCRADFAASSLWPKLGFVTVRERPARESERTLKTWWLDYCHGDLFTSVSSGPLTVLDANVVYDLQDRHLPRSTESMALLADWVRDAFTFAVTHELFAEIDRNTSSDERRRRREFALEFTRVSAPESHLRATREQVRGIMGAPTTQSDSSDQEHLCHAVWAQADYFITRDQAVLDNAKTFQETLGIRILRPVDLIGDHVEELHPTLYVPGRLDGSSLSIRSVRASEIDSVVEKFQNYADGETTAGLRRILREAIAQQNQTTVQLVVADDELVGLMIVCPESSIHRILAIRVTAGTLGATIGRHLLWRQVIESEGRGAGALRFEDRYPSPGVAEGLADLGFIPATGGAVKPFLRGALSAADTRISINALGDRDICPPELIDRILADLDCLPDPLIAAGLERALWPLRLRGSGLPCFIVPIQPKWAVGLFETIMASESLFAPNADVFLRFENAYYRSGSPRIVEAPGRVLWYVSQQEHYSRTMCVSAVSSINEVTSGLVEQVYRLYKRYGVYQWADLQGLTPDSAGNIQGFTFSHTSCFPRPMSFTDVTAFLMARIGRQYTFPSPLRLDEDVWLDLWQMCSDSAAPQA